MYLTSHVASQNATVYQIQVITCMHHAHRTCGSRSHNDHCYWTNVQVVKTYSTTLVHKGKYSLADHYGLYGDLCS